MSKEKLRIGDTVQLRNLKRIRELKATPVSIPITRYISKVGVLINFLDGDPVVKFDDCCALYRTKSSWLKRLASPGKRLIFEVTKANIKNGRPTSSKECPIALAIKQHFPCLYVSVGIFNVTVGETEYEVSRRGKRFICNFDDGKPVKPASFAFSSKGS